MELINLHFEEYIKNDSSFAKLNSQLTKFTRNFVGKYFRESISDWQDIYQEVIIKVISLRQYILSGASERPRNFKSYFARMIQNHINNYKKKQKREQNNFNEYKYYSEGTSGMQSNQLEETDLFKHFLAILKTIKNQNHAEIFLDKVRGLTIEAIAEKYKITNDNVYKITERVKQTMSPVLKQFIINSIRAEVEEIFLALKKYNKKLEMNETVLKMILNKISDSVIKELRLDVYEAIKKEILKKYK